MLLLSRTITCITIKSYRTSTQCMRSTFSISFIFLRRNPGQKSPLAMTENHANDVSFHWFWVDIQIKVRKGIKGLYSTHSMGFMKIHFHSPFIANDKNISPKHDMKWRQNKQQRKHGGGGWNVPNLWAFFFRLPFRSLSVLYILLIHFVTFLYVMVSMSIYVRQQLVGPPAKCHANLMENSQNEILAVTGIRRRI